ncbi:T9SS type A sorting domain-containing protein, partial [candidate division KSB1 bacterium]|nr:T9SS type A sorting domain-containing protein [candidate division KSB1 bacterium]
VYNDSTKGWYDFSEIPRTSFYSSAWTAGAMVSTAEDMVRWARALYGGQVLAPNSLEQMFTLITFNHDILLGYGLGMFKQKMLGQEVWLHGGDTFCFGSQAAYIPAKDVSIAVLVNQRNYPYQDFYNMLTEQFLKIVLSYFAYPHDKVFPYGLQVSSAYLKPEQDRLKITAKLNNPNAHQAQVVARILNTNRTFTDSISLFDDGNHADGPAGDGLWGGDLEPIAIEDNFSITVSSRDLNTNYYHVSRDSKQFTTIGPIVLESYTITSADTLPNPGDEFDIRITLKNNGATVTATQITAWLSTLDSLGIVARNIKANFRNLEPGQAYTPGSRFGIRIADHCPENSKVSFLLNIASNGYPFWSDTLSIFVEASTEISNLVSKMPLDFKLNQNYPNPFNPKTMISYQVPVLGNVELKIYSVTGQTVCTLVDGPQPAGSYQHEWEAGSLASGVYFYRLKTDKFVQMKKLILLK